jgi:hypothetical protein
MSENEESHKLQPSIDAILEGINNFDTAAKKRMIFGEYSKEHVADLVLWRKKFLDLHLELLDFKKKYF